MGLCFVKDRLYLVEEADSGKKTRRVNLSTRYQPAIVAEIYWSYPCRATPCRSTRTQSRVRPSPTFSAALTVSCWHPWNGTSRFLSG